MIDWFYVFHFPFEKWKYSIQKETSLLPVNVAKWRSLPGDCGLWSGRDLYRATPAVTRGLGFRVTSEGPPRVVTLDAEVLFLPRSSRNGVSQLLQHTNPLGIILYPESSNDIQLVNQNNFHIHLVTYLYMQVLFM